MSQEPISTTNASSPPHGDRTVVLALYKFVSIPKEEIQSLKTEVEQRLRLSNARVTILLAEEGINGTICYSEKDAAGSSESAEEKGDGDAVRDYLENHAYFAGLRTRVSYVDTPIFHRLKVKIKKEIVTIGGTSNTPIGADADANSDGNNHHNNEKDESENKPIGYMSPCIIDPTKICGQYADPDQWDQLCEDPDVVVIDTRNKYEIDVGTFRNAISPNTDNFRQFPDWLHRFANSCQAADEHEDAEANDKRENGGAKPLHEKDQCVINRERPVEEPPTTTNARNLHPVPEEDMPIVRKKPKAIAMFCTGGIRCEKSTSYTLAAQVFPPNTPIYHLEGGVLAYLNARPDEKQSQWEGECFVFYQRVAVTHGLKPSMKYHACHACRKPISKEDMEREDYAKGISCRYCVHRATEKQKIRFEERQKQMEMAKEKGSVHIHDSKVLV